MVKVSDYIMATLIQHGIEELFMITGGGAMHLNDSAGKCLNFFCNHHEQASAIAAEGYARVSGKIAVVLVTTGPGGTNTLTGVLGQWTDSVPVLYLSGQVKFETTIRSSRTIPLRQLGDQEVDIVEIVKPITKFAACVTKPEDIRCMLEKAIYLATEGRPGPVWLDIPMNVQGAMIDEGNLPGFDPAESGRGFLSHSSPDIAGVVDLLIRSARPVIVAGHGIRISGAQDKLKTLINTLKIPVLSTFNGFDLISTDTPCFVGRIGTIGDRAGNFALQNADFVLSIGSRNNIRQISYTWKNYARAAKKVFVDIDENELNKPTIKADIAIHADARYFISELITILSNVKTPAWDKWLQWCIERKKKYPVVLPGYEKHRGLVNPYYFAHVLSNLLSENSIVVTGNGSASVTYFQAGVVKDGQRVIWNSGCASMGYDLPAAIGACLGSGKKKVICIAGDGSIQMNIQELASIAYHQLPIIIFLLNNNGYISIRQTQTNFFGNLVGCDPKSGVSLPDMQAIAKAYGITTMKITEHENIDNLVREALSYKGPLLCEVMLQPDYTFTPKLSSEKKPDGRIVSKPLEDMYPFLDRTEFLDNMIIEPINDNF